MEKIKRKEKDIMKLTLSDYEVSFPSKENRDEFLVKLTGPKDSPYEEVSRMFLKRQGIWIVRVMLPEDYPYKSPSIGFVNKIYHPNIDEA